MRFKFVLLTALPCLGLAMAPLPAQRATPSATPLYRQPKAPVEARVQDLLRRLTLEEKVRQLDLYTAARTIVDKHSDDTHAAPDAVFLPDKAQALFGTLGVGGLHALNPTPQ